MTSIPWPIWLDIATLAGQGAMLIVMLRIKLEIARLQVYMHENFEPRRHK